MTTAEQLKHDSQDLLIGLAHGATGAALDQLVVNVSLALTDSFANGDTISVADTGQPHTNRLQVLSALNQGYMIAVDSAALKFD